MGQRPPLQATVLNFKSYLVKTISSYLYCRTFQKSVQSTTFICRGMRAGVVQGGLVSPVLFSMYVNGIPTPSCGVELAQYADDTAVVATFRSPSKKPRAVQFLGKPIQWVETARYQLTWSAHVNQVGKKAHKLGVLGPVIKRRSGLSVRNGVLLHKQLFRPMMVYAYPIWRCAAHSHVRKLQVLQSKCLRIATNAPWYVSNKQIHDDL
jgi:hypothetical protein